MWLETENPFHQHGLIQMLSIGNEALGFNYFETDWSVLLHFYQEWHN